jgi:hypothetical protein
MNSCVNLLDFRPRQYIASGSFVNAVKIPFLAGVFLSLTKQASKGTAY